MQMVEQIFGILCAIINLTSTTPDVELTLPMLRNIAQFSK